MKPVIIRVRRGLNGHKYAACNDKGRFICNFYRLAMPGSIGILKYA